MIFNLLGRTSGRAESRTETMALYHKLRAAHEAAGYGYTDIIDRLSDAIADQVGKEVEIPACRELAEALDRFQREIFALESVMFTFPDIDWNTASLSLDEIVSVNQFLRAKQKFLDNDDWILERTGGCLVAVIEALLTALPQIDDGDGEVEVVPLVTVLADPGSLIDKIIGTFTKDEFVEMGVFSVLQQQLYDNVCRASGLTVETRGDSPLITADQSTLYPVELAKVYLRETPLLDLFLTRVPFP